MRVCLLGPIWGDVCGAPYEFAPERDAGRVDLAHPGQRFTDDTVLTLAVAKAIVEGRPYGEVIFELASRYRDRGFGGRFYRRWVEGRDPRPYGSFGNGAAMRVAPVGWAFETVGEVLAEAGASAACSHDHPDGVASAQAVALAVFLARKGQDKEAIRGALEGRFGWDLSASLGEIRAEAARVGFDETWRSVPPAVGVFLNTESFEACLREAIALGGGRGHAGVRGVRGGGGVLWARRGVVAARGGAAGWAAAADFGVVFGEVWGVGAENGPGRIASGPGYGGIGETR